MEPWNAPGKRTVFIGSSSEALTVANQLAAFLKSHSADAIEPVVWNVCFAPGSIVVETLESVAQSVSGAMFVAYPDDRSVIRGKDAKTARANVLLEYGFFISHLDRRRVALCPFNGVELPSDANGITYVALGDAPEDKDLPTWAVPVKAGEAIISWARSLPLQLHDIPTQKVYNGLSGRWSVRTRFSKWRGRSIRENESVLCESEIILSIPRLSRTSQIIEAAGAEFGTLTVSLEGCLAVFNVSDKITNIRLEPDGGLSLFSESFSRERIHLDGVLPGGHADGFEQQLRGLRKFSQTLRPGPRSGTLVGEYVSASSEAVVEFERR